MWDYRGQKRPPFAVEPGPGQESVWDYPRPPRLEACQQLVEVRHNDMIIARSHEAIRVLETASPPTFYIPEKDIIWTQLIESPEQSFCEWKGKASYWKLASDPSGLPVAWQYNEPLPGFEVIRAYVSFYPGRVDCFVDEEAVQPQHSEFYGGWVTSEIVGPFKGDPGTGGW